MLRDGQQLRFSNHAGLPWTVAWHPPQPAPSGTPHGSAAICRTPDQRVVLVSADGGESYYFPGGRPQGAEEWRMTLEREVLEEACATVVDARLLGFSRGTGLGGPEKGRVLVRALWVADVVLDPWEPEHEMTHRILVGAEEVLSCIEIVPGLEPLIHRWVREALGLAAAP